MDVCRHYSRYWQIRSLILVVPFISAMLAQSNLKNRAIRLNF